MNVCTFIGRVGGDAETRSTQNGKPVTNWSVAVDIGYGEKKSTMWVRCTLWGDRGPKIAEYIRRGDMIGVSGELSVSEYDGKNGKGFSVDLNTREVQLLGNKNQPTAKPESEAAPPADDLNDEIPF